MWWKKATKMPPDVEERLLTCERELRAIRLEWESAYDKLVSIVSRFNKRAERIAASERLAEQESDTRTGPATAVPRALDPVSQRILARRQRLFQRQAGNSTEEEKTG